VAFQLPSASDVQAQKQAGENLAQQIELAAGGNQDAVNSLLEAGIAIAGNAIGGLGGDAVAMVGGALAGLAMAGPMGAAIAAVGAFAQDVVSAFSAGVDTSHAVGASEATATIANRIQAMGIPVGLGPNIGKPGGWSAADWSAFARPPSSTKNTQKLLSIARNGWNYAWNQTMGGNVPGNMPYPGLAPQFSTPSAFASFQQPLCTPVFFYWTQPSNIVDCVQDAAFGSGGAGGSVSTLKQRWVQGTTPRLGLSQSQIVEAAIPRLPDPLYWSGMLYAAVGMSGLSGYSTTYTNVDLLNGIATWLTMLCAGASMQAVVSELLLQSYILGQQGDQDTSGNPIKNPSQNQYGFHQLVGDAISIAQQENAAMPVASVGFPLSGQIGAFFAGASGMALAAILAYSLFTRTSPLVVTRMAVQRVRSL